MKTYVSNRDITVNVPFETDGEPFVPDAGSLVYSLTAPDGTALVSSQAISTTDTSVNITVPSIHNVMSAALSELRFIEVSGRNANRPFEITLAYRLTPRILMTVSPDAVRGFLGVDAGELPDRDIDLIDAFLELAEQVSNPLTLISQDTEAGRNFNKAVVYKTVLNILPSLPQRLSKSETDGTSKVDRFNIDFADLEREARNRLASALGAETVTRTLVQFTTRPDPLTGA